MKKRTFIKLSSALITGTMFSPIKTWAQKEKLHNWAGNYEYSTENLSYANSFNEISSLLKKFTKVKVLGTRHCFNGIADSKDNFISLKQLEQVIALDKNAMTATVAASTRYGKLAEFLQKNGFALHNLASLPHISVAGACITATHGSGVHNGNLSTAVSGLEIVKANGETVMLSRKHNADEFQAAVVNLGGLGVISKVTLNIQPTYDIRQDVLQNLPFRALETHFDEIMSSGYSVSLFTDWQNDNVSQVWIKSRIEKDKKQETRTQLFGATPATRNLHPIEALSAENCTDQMGVPGPWHERLPHFKMNFTPSSGKELQSEYFVPREHSFHALSAISDLHKEIGPHLFISEIRTIDQDDLWMSTAYRRPSTSIHFTWKQDWPAVSKLLPMIEEKLSPFHPRPHWGKLFTLNPQKFKSMYEKLPAFQKMLKEYDPQGKFRNDFLSRNIYEI